MAQRDTWIERKAPGRPGRGGRRPRRFAPAYRPDVISRLDANGLLPAITFIFSRAGCDAAVEQCLIAGLRLTTPEEAEVIKQVAERRTADIPPEDLTVLGYGEWLDGLRRGIAAHHAGMLPAFKEVVEELFAAGLVRAVFATETLALGINMPARTVVIEKLDKWNGETHANLTAGEYTQLTGRAGRRGIDVEGHAVVLWQPGMDPGAVGGLASTRTYPLNSSFRPSYNMAVNLTGWAGRARASTLLESSFAQFQADRGVVGLTRQVRRNRQAMADLAASMSCDKGDFAEYAELRRSLTEREGDLSRARASSRRAEAARSLSLLRPGDIIRVPGGRRAGLAVVLQPGLHPARGGNGNGRPADRAGRGPVGQDRPANGRSGPRRPADNGRGVPEFTGPGPLVLTEGRQVKRLAVADFPVPAEVIDKIRIPGSFSPRSPQHRKDLAATMRNRLASRPPGAKASRRPVRAADWERAAPGADDIADLRRRLRRHPCHDCPDREDHARYAERYMRLARETEALERRVAGRSHVIARTFDRVCRVLERLGYLAGRHRHAGRAATGPPVHRAGPAGRRVPAPRPVGRPVPGRTRRLRVRPVLRVTPGRRRPAAPAAEGPGPRGARRHGPYLGRARPAGKGQRAVVPARARPRFRLGCLPLGPRRAAGKRPGRIARPHPRRFRPLRQAAHRPAGPDRLRRPGRMLPRRTLPRRRCPGGAAPAGGLAATARAAIDAMRRGVIAYSAVADYRTEHHRPPQH